MTDPGLDHIHTEDAFLVDEEGWIHMPGGEGTVSPSGIVYDENGDELYSIYDAPSSSDLRIAFLEEGEEGYEWI